MHLPLREKIVFKSVKGSYHTTVYRIALGMSLLCKKIEKFHLALAKYEGNNAVVNNQKGKS